MHYHWYHWSICTLFEKMFGILDQKLQLTEADVTTCDVADLCVISDY